MLKYHFEGRVQGLTWFCLQQGFEGCILQVTHPEGPYIYIYIYIYTTIMEFRSQKDHPHNGFGDLISIMVVCMDSLGQGPHEAESLLALN